MTVQLSITQNQVDSDTPVVRRVIAEIVRFAGRRGAHRNPIVLQAPFGHRVEYLQVIREVGVQCQIGSIASLVDPNEFAEIFFADSQPDACMYLAGEALPKRFQERIVELYRDDVKRHFAPQLFGIVTNATPAKLREQRVWIPEFCEIIGARIVTVPTSEERTPEDLVALFHAAVRRAALRKQVKYKIQPGATDLLLNRWAQKRPVSLDLIVAGAEKAVADAQSRDLRIAAEVMRNQRYLITGKEVIDAFMPDSPLASRPPSAPPPDATRH